MATPSEVAAHVQQLADAFETNVKVYGTRIALNIQKELVEVTPVDEGTGISNWRVTREAPASGTIPAYAPGKHGSTAEANRMASIQQAEAVLANLRGRYRVFITNNLPYIAKLNDGSSKQAPAGFVQVAIIKGLTSTGYNKVFK